MDVTTTTAEVYARLQLSLKQKGKPIDAGTLKARQ
jgi:hypothetical protein